MRWFDGHLDLAYLAELGRDMHAQPEYARGRLTPVAVTLPSLAEGSVRACLGTIFTEPVNNPGSPGAETGAFAYPAGDAQAARAAGLRQLKLYHAWRDAGLIELMPRREALPGDPQQPARARAEQPAGQPPLRVGVLMEGADPIESPDDLPEWVEGGVIAIGLTWSLGTRYAGGNAAGDGLSPIGRELVAAMDHLGVLHDASHLSDRALDDLLAASDRLVIASHSNCRALVGDDQRHLHDHAIAEIGRRGGVVGINLYSRFLDATSLADLGAGSAASPGPPPTGGRASVECVADHAEHIAAVMGHRRGVALGSDMDGGFAADRLPEGIDRPRGLVRIAEALARRGWTDADVRAFAWDNWDRVLR